MQYTKRQTPNTKHQTPDTRHQTAKHQTAKPPDIQPPTAKHDTLNPRLYLNMCSVGHCVRLLRPTDTF